MKKLAMLLLVLGFTAPAFAETKSEENPCKKDREMLRTTVCKDAKPVHDMMKCLHDHKDEVSAACKTYRETHKEEWKKNHAEMKEAMKEACDKDPSCKAKKEEMKENHKKARKEK